MREIATKHLIQREEQVPKERVSSELERAPYLCENGFQDSLSYKTSTYSYVDEYKIVYHGAGNSFLGLFHNSQNGRMRSRGNQRPI